MKTGFWLSKSINRLASNIIVIPLSKPEYKVSELWCKLNILKKSQTGNRN